MSLLLLLLYLGWYGLGGENLLPRLLASDAALLPLLPVRRWYRWCGCGTGAWPWTWPCELGGRDGTFLALRLS